MGKTHLAAGICRCLIALDRTAGFSSGTALVQECRGPLPRPPCPSIWGCTATSPMTVATVGRLVGQHHDPPHQRQALPQQEDTPTVPRPRQELMVESTQPMSGPRA